MKPGAPEARGWVSNEPIARAGRARRFACGAGELWRLAAEDEPLARRLLALGVEGVGGFTDGGLDDGGAWLVRTKTAPTLASWLDEHEGPIRWRESVVLAVALARCLDACERASLHPGPLDPKGVAVDVEGDRIACWLKADPLVFGLVGAETELGSRSGGSPRWSAPEQASGTSSDNATNRYVLGLVLYRLLAGEHPFGGAGLRLALDAQERQGAPPFSDAVARALPPGLQSLCLRLLDPERARRPASSRQIAEALELFLDEERPASAPKRARRAADTPLPAFPATAAPQRARSVSARSRAALPLTASVALALLALWAFGKPKRSAHPVAPRAPLTSANAGVATCATCHAREAAEWRRSSMAYSVVSPLFESLEMLVEEQIGRTNDCPNGAGILRSADPATACRNPRTGIAITGSGGALWCVNCHAPGENLQHAMPPWNALGGDARSRWPLASLLPRHTLQGVGCTFCHEVRGPAHPGNLGRGLYEGNPTWLSPRTGELFHSRPEDRRGVFGISNSGYFLDPSELLGAARPPSDWVASGVHARPTAGARAYLESSQFCGSCHDVRLFGTDVLGAARGEHFKRLRNAYSEWRQYAKIEERAGRRPATCEDCHMSTYPGICVRGAGATNDAAFRGICPKGTHFERRAPGRLGRGFQSSASPRSSAVFSHTFTGVDQPLSPAFDPALFDDPTLDADGVPEGGRQRRDLLLKSAVTLELDHPSLRGHRLEIPVVVENVGAGHRVPAGFSQERELWVHLKVTDRNGALVYEVGRIDRPDEDLRSRIFLRVNTDDDVRDARGRPLGLFGADVADGPDVPRWSPSPDLGGTHFRGKGLINFQNGFLRCVRCIGRIDDLGRCQPLPGQQRARADRYADGDYDPDTGECRSNLSGRNALFETYFPVGALDASRGVIKAPDAIISTRSLPPQQPVEYDYELSTHGRPGPFTVRATLLFRAFPPYLIRAFAAYERRQAARGLRPNGPLITDAALARLQVVKLRRARAEVP